jgi:hypothetical protein
VRSEKGEGRRVGARGLIVGGLAPSLLAGLVLAQPVPAPDSLRPTGFPAGCAPGTIEVMLVGTYHFAGSATDAVETPAADILSPQRQRELELLTDRLASWRPDQVAVEWPYLRADTTHARYQRYLEGTLTESRNEVVQLGFRLARTLGHATVHPIDHQMSIGNDSLRPLLERRPEFQARVDSLMAIFRARADSTRAWHERTTLIEHLIAANSEAGLRNGNSLGMFGSWLAAGEGTNYGGPQLLARWYERNFMMAHHLTRTVAPGTRRILVLVGSGHVPPLRNILDESPAFCPVSPLGVLGG